MLILRPSLVPVLSRWAWALRCTLR
jgi:hypothetical protein